MKLPNCEAGEVCGLRYMYSVLVGVYVHKDVVIDRAFVMVTSILHISGREDIVTGCMRAVGMPMPIYP